MSESRKTILLVDDDDDIRLVLCEVLEQEGFVVGVATNGSEAINYLEVNPAPSLILLDLMMPVMGGLQFREIQMKSPKWAGIPVVVMSADELHQGKVKDERLQGAVLLRKPPDLENFLETVHAHVAQ